MVCIAASDTWVEGREAAERIGKMTLSRHGSKEEARASAKSPIPSSRRQAVSTLSTETSL
eukprot:768749-Hanusia_phi.AAC.27